MENYRTRHRERSQQLPWPDFKHGLKIRMKPLGFDFERLDPEAGLSLTMETSVPEGVEVFNGSLAEFEQAGIEGEGLDAFLDDTWQTPADDHKLFHMQQAYLNHVTVIRIKQGQALDKPVDISYLLNRGPVFGCVWIVAERQSEGTVILQKTMGEKQAKPLENPAEQYFSHDVRVLAQAGSRVTVASVDRFSSEIVHYQKHTARIERDAEVNWLDLGLGSNYAQGDFVSRMEGQGSRAETMALYLSSDKQRRSLYTESCHVGRYTESNIITRGVITDQAKALSRGLVRIETDAFGSNGYETQDALLLSPKAEADAIPNLEIHNHDVKCSHGSTVGQIDAETLHYLRSRGLGDAAARQMLVGGYFDPILSKLAIPGLREQLETSIEQMFDHA